MIKLITFHEDQWFRTEFGADYSQWKHLANGFNTDFQMIDRWEQAEVPEGYEVVLVDQEGTEPYTNLEDDHDLVLIFGKTGLSLPEEIDTYDRCVYYPTPNNKVAMFGITIASIILNHLLVL